MSETIERFKKHKNSSQLATLFFNRKQTKCFYFALLLAHSLASALGQRSSVRTRAHFYLATTLRAQMKLITPHLSARSTNERRGARAARVSAAYATISAHAHARTHAHALPRRARRQSPSLARSLAVCNRHAIGQRDRNVKTSATAIVVASTTSFDRVAIATARMGSGAHVSPSYRRRRRHVRQNVAIYFFHHSNRENTAKKLHVTLFCFHCANRDVSYFLGMTFAA